MDRARLTAGAPSAVVHDHGMRALAVLCALCGLASAAPAEPDLRATDWCNWSYANNQTYPALMACKATVDERHSEHGGTERK